jgi:hypothetical protein
MTTLKQRLEIYEKGFYPDVSGTTLEYLLVIHDRECFYDKYSLSQRFVNNYLADDDIAYRQKFQYIGNNENTFKKQAREYCIEHNGSQYRLPPKNSAWRQALSRLQDYENRYGPIEVEGLELD